MTRNMRLSGWVGAVALAATAAACGGRTTDKAADAARSAGTAASQAGDTAVAAGREVAGAAVDATRAAGDAVANGGRAADAAVQMLDVKVALAADSRVDSANINVDTDHIAKMVTLKGHVPTEAQKTIAGQIATEKAVGYRIRNDLRVGA